MKAELEGTDRAVQETADTSLVAQLDKPTLALLQQSPVGMLIHQDDRFVYANPAVALLHGTTAQDESGLCEDLLDRFRHDGDLNAALSHDAVGRVGDYAWKTADGSEIWIQVFASPVQWNDAPARQIWLTDITRQKEEQRELLRSRDQMAIMAKAVQ